MRSKGTWVFLFFALSTIMAAMVFNHAFNDLFSLLQINNAQVLGDTFRLSSLAAAALALLMGLFFGLFYKKSRNYVEQCVAEFNKVAFSGWKETKSATFTVVAVSFIASIILGVFDNVFSWWTSNNLFIW